MPHENLEEKALEAEIQRKGLTAPRLTPDEIDALIISEQFHIFEGTTMTVCCLTLRNGFSVVGESTCISSSNFDEDIGRRIARRRAREKIWPLAAYAFMDSLLF